MKIKQLFFDCDNTLVLSEGVAFEACAGLVNQLLERHNISDRYNSDQIVINFIGQSFKGIMQSLMQKYNFTMSAEEVKYFVKAEEIAVIKKIQAKGIPCPGSMEVLQKLHAEKEYDLAVVSSSALGRISASLAKTQQDKFFGYSNIYSAASSLPEPAPKPDPAIYIWAMKRLGVKPEDCAAVEDSCSGAGAAVGAGANCIGYVGSYTGRIKQEEVADTLLKAGCKAIMTHWSEFEEILAKIEEE